jgi:uncharacterized protein YggU (UPF0235/DUF167 family)
VIPLQRHELGWVLTVRAIPGARRNELRGQQDGALKVCVTQIPEKGRANAALRDLLAKTLRLRKSQIELLAGHTSNLKKFLLRDIDAEQLQARLAPYLDA